MNNISALFQDFSSRSFTREGFGDLLKVILTAFTLVGAVLMMIGALSGTDSKTNVAKTETEVEQQYQTPPQSTILSMYELQQDIYATVNIWRANSTNGALPVVASSELEARAVEQAQASAVHEKPMAINGNHNVLITHLPYQYSEVYYFNEAVIRSAAWMSTITNTRYSSVGVGVAYSNSTSNGKQVWIVLQFG